MGTNNLTTKASNQIISPDDPNQYKTAFIGDLVPRNSTGSPEANSGSVGSASYPVKRLHATVGDWVCGDIKMFDSYNGLLNPGQGWYPLDGSQLTKEAYDAIHGVGSWDNFIISSPLEGKFVKNCNNRFPVGKSTTDQDGSTEQTYEGNTNNQVDLDHQHDINPHKHQWLKKGAATESDKSWSKINGEVGITQGGTKTSGSAYGIQWATSGQTPIAAELSSHTEGFYTDTGGPETTLGENLSATQSIQPDSFQTEYWIRII